MASMRINDSIRNPLFSAAIYGLRPLYLYASFNGRASRREFWGFAFVCLLSTIIGWLFDWWVMGAASLARPDVFGVAVVILLVLPSITVTARRLHDVGRSGWWQLLLLVPVAGWLALLVWSLRRGESGPNRFGRDPRTRYRILLV